MSLDPEVFDACMAGGSVIHAFPSVSRTLSCGAERGEERVGQTETLGLRGAFEHHGGGHCGSLVFDYWGGFCPAPYPLTRK